MHWYKAQVILGISYVFWKIGLKFKVLKFEFGLNCKVFKVENRRVAKLGCMVGQPNLPLDRLNMALNWPKSGFTKLYLWFSGSSQPIISSSRSNRMKI